MPMIKRSGIYGMTRQQLGHAVDLDRAVLDELLAGLVGVGLLFLSKDARGPVYYPGHVFNPGRSSAASP